MFEILLSKQTPDEVQRVVDLIREVGVERLGCFDGCVCCRFSVRHVDVEISCGKDGSRGVWISSRSLSYSDGRDGCDETLLRPIAEEVRRQAEKADERGSAPVRYHEWRRE